MERESLFIIGSEMNRMSALDKMNERRKLLELFNNALETSEHKCTL